MTQSSVRTPSPVSVFFGALEEQAGRTRTAARRAGAAQRRRFMPPETAARREGFRLWRTSGVRIPPTMSTRMHARVALVGLGPIGVEVGKALAGREGLTLLGAADPAPDKAGHPVSELLGGAFPGVAIRGSAAELYRETAASRGRADVVLLCTGSRLHTILPQIEEAIAAGFHIVSTCEELAYPELRHLPMARRIDAAARQRGVAVLGTGVNPGLVMGRLVLAAASACVRVDAVRVTRVV